MIKTRAKGGGRKPAPCKTKVVAFRLREEHVQPVKKWVKDFVNSQNKKP